jgi:hypothetical protein
MPFRMNRRHWFGMVLSAIVSFGLGHEVSATTVMPMDTTFWEKTAGPYCFASTRYETWCYVEGAGGPYQTLWCEDRQVGSC